MRAEFSLTTPLRGCRRWRRKCGSARTTPVGRRWCGRHSPPSPASCSLRVWRLVRVAGSRGAYTPDVVRGLRSLAWWLLAGAVLAPIVQDIANAQLLRTLSADYSYTFQLPDISLAAVLTGLGLITLTRVMRNAVRMREDLEGLV
ncbi:DUF2975 domain-containing protein [Streptosporangium saharense]|uniref:DUF2975 domain-containing protein n=1 Tax=Streptosporangium saharense TaxID=1706840 RepID=UPI00369EB582